ncbi:hypothetical protein AAMO2058_000708200 [Amorphochlora amoebiformis]
MRRGLRRLLWGFYLSLFLSILILLRPTSVENNLNRVHRPIPLPPSVKYIRMDHGHQNLNPNTPSPDPDDEFQNPTSHEYLIMKNIPSINPCVGDFGSQVIVYNTYGEHDEVGVNAIVRMCASHGNNSVVVISVSKSQAEAAAAKLRNQLPSLTIHTHQVNTSSSHNVIAFRSWLNETLGKIDTIVSHVVYRGRKNPLAPHEENVDVMQNNLFAQMTLLDELSCLYPNWARVLVIIHPSAFQLLRRQNTPERQFYLNEYKQRKSIYNILRDHVSRPPISNPQPHSTLALSHYLLSIYTEALSNDLSHRAVSVNALCPLPPPISHKLTDTSTDDDIPAGKKPVDDDSAASIAARLMSLPIMATRLEDEDGGIRVTGNTYLANLKSLLKL